MFPDPTSRQRQVEYGTLEEDIARRDFTVNMLLKDLTTGEVKDLTGVSIQDLKEGVLRGHPGVSFDKILADDPLRMLRLVRFQVKYGWDVPIDVLRAVRRNAKRIEIVSGERIRDELIKMASLGKLGQAIRIMKTTGLLQYVFPEIQAMKGVEHEYSKGSHQEGDVYKHTLMVLQNAKPDVESQFAALLHDIGKPQSQEVVEGLIRFLGHEKVGGEMAEAVMRRLRFDNDVVMRVRMMVENHMRPHHLTREEAGPKALRKFIREVGQELVGAVLDLAEADQLGTVPPQNMIPDLRQEIDVLMAPVQKAEELPLDGNDVQRILGIKKGKAVGDALKYLKDTKYEWELEGRAMTKEDAEQLLIKRFGMGV
jgi:poly(A) polymerase